MADTREYLSENSEAGNSLTEPPAPPVPAPGIADNARIPEGDPCDEESLRAQVAALQASITSRQVASSSGNTAGVMAQVTLAQNRLRELVESVTTLQGERAELVERVNRLTEVSNKGSADLEATKEKLEIERNMMVTEVNELRTVVQREIHARQELEPQLNEVLQLIENQAEIHESLLQDRETIEQEIETAKISLGHPDSPGRQGLTTCGFSPPKAACCRAGQQQGGPLYFPSRESFPNLPDFQAFLDAFTRDIGDNVDNNQRRGYARFMLRSGIDSPARNMENFPSVGYTDARGEYLRSLEPDAVALQRQPWTPVGALQNARQVGIHIHGMSPNQQTAYLQQYTQNVDQGPSSPLNYSIPLNDQSYSPRCPAPNRAQGPVGEEEWVDAKGIIDADAAAFEAFGNQGTGINETFDLAGGARDGFGGPGQFGRSPSYDNPGPAGIQPRVVPFAGFGATPNASPTGDPWSNLSPGGNFSPSPVGGNIRNSPPGGFPPLGNSFNVSPGGAVYSPRQQASPSGGACNYQPNQSSGQRSRSPTPTRNPFAEPNPAEVNSFDGYIPGNGDSSNLNQTRTAPNQNGNQPMGTPGEGYFENDSWADDSILALGAQLVREGRIQLNPNTGNETQDSLLNMTNQMSQNGEISFLNSACKAPMGPQGASTPNSNQNQGGALPDPNISPIANPMGNQSNHTPRQWPESPPPSPYQFLRHVQWNSPPKPVKLYSEYMVPAPREPNATVTFNTDETLMSVPSLSISAAFAMIDAEDANGTPPPYIPYQAPTPPMPQPRPRPQPQSCANGRRMPTWAQGNFPVEAISPSHRPMTDQQRAQNRAEDLEWLNAVTNGDYDRWNAPRPPPRADVSDDLENNIIEVTGDESYHRAMYHFENSGGPYPLYRDMPYDQAVAREERQRVLDFQDYHAGNQVYRPLDHVQRYYETQQRIIRENEQHFRMREMLEQVPPEERDEVWQKQMVIYGDDPDYSYLRAPRMRIPPPPPPRPPTPQHCNIPRRLPFSRPAVDTNIDEYLTNNPLQTSGAGISSVSTPNMNWSPGQSFSPNLSGGGLSSVSTPSMYKTSSQPFSPSFDQFEMSGVGLSGVSMASTYQSMDTSVHLSPPPSPMGGFQPVGTSTPVKTPETSAASVPAGTCTPPPRVFGPPGRPSGSPYNSTRGQTPPPGYDMINTPPRMNATPPQDYDVIETPPRGTCQYVPPTNGPFSPDIEYDEPETEYSILSMPQTPPPRFSQNQAGPSNRQFGPVPSWSNRQTQGRGEDYPACSIQ